MALKFKSRLMKHVYESAKDLYEIGAINAEKLQEFEAGCTVPQTGGANARNAAHGAAAPAPAYANPTLIPQEKGAWERAVTEN